MADPFQLGGNALGELAERLGLVVAHLPHQFLGFVRSERYASAEHFVEHDAEAVDVRAAVDAMSFPRDLLGRHVGRRAGNDAQFVAAGRRVVECQSKIDQHGIAVRGHQDVGRFHVAMNGELGMRVSERLGHRADDRRGSVARSANAA